MSKPTWPLLNELNQNAYAQCQRLVSQSQRYQINVLERNGATLLDFAIGRPGTLAAGLELAQICMGGLGTVSLESPCDPSFPMTQIRTTTDHPLEACIAAQYAGWPISEDSFFAMCSGPARSARGKEKILIDYDLIAPAPQVVGVLETDQLPEAPVIQQFADACSVAPEQAILCIAPTASLPGTIQVVARSLETALHKLHELEFDLRTVHSGMGTAPMPPIASDNLTALGWTNDAILYGGCVHLWVATDDTTVESIGARLPSSSSPDYGEPFLELFQRADHDFYKIDPLLFSPAQIVVNNLKTGRVFSFGELRHDLLRTSWGL